MAETKPKPNDSLRTPKPKKKLGLAVPPALRLPHDDLISPSAKEPGAQASMPSQTSQDDGATMPSQTSMSTTTSQTSTTRHTQQPTPVSPVRDFTKVANSIHREAVPAGLFNGKSKQLYDCLYSLSRGAVVPSRTVRISRPRLMKLAGIGARVTFDANIARLVAVGLIQVRTISGEHNGNEYNVLLPEELSLTSLTSLTSHAQNLDRLVRLETSQTSHTSFVENKDTSGDPNTSFKTKDINTDDEAFAEFAAALRKAAKDLTGKEPSKADSARWAEVAEVLMTELRIAAGRTTVSNVPAFLAEHLRRRLWKKEKRQLEAETESAEQKASAPARKVDASQCPECFGTGMYYPEGYDKGVAKCTHSKLTTESEG